MTHQPDPRLLPCPFCGESRIYLNPPDKKIGSKGSINCPACLVAMPREYSEQELIDCWNDRSGSGPSGVEMEAMAKAAQEFWQGPSGRTWEQCCKDTPPQAEWFRKLIGRIVDQSYQSETIEMAAALPRAEA